MSKFYFFMLLLCGIATAQDRNMLYGQVTSENGAVYNVYVINKTTAEEVKTDAAGNFNLMAAAGDMLVVYSDKTKVRQFLVSEKSFTEKPFSVYVELKEYELEEVVVEKKAVTSESLGLVPKGYKEYTPAERRLNAATGRPFDALINAITGRTKMLKKALETENKEFMIATLNGLFTTAEIKNFSIPEDYVNGFLFYIVEDDEFADAVKSNNEELMKFLMHGLAEKYVSNIKGEGAQIQSPETEAQKD